MLIRGTTLTVGFDYEVQSIGNQGQGDDRFTAGFTDNLDGTYTVYHGFQIYNPNVGNPRADTSTRFEITEDPDNPNRILIITVDDEPAGVLDGIPGTQIAGVFPMTVQPDFEGNARLEGSSSGGDGISDQLKEQLGLNPDADNADTDGDGLPDAEELGRPRRTRWTRMRMVSSTLWSLARRLWIPGWQPVWRCSTVSLGGR